MKQPQINLAHQSTDNFDLVCSTEVGLLQLPRAWGNYAVKTSVFAFV